MYSSKLNRTIVLGLILLFVVSYTNILQVSNNTTINQEVGSINHLVADVQDNLVNTEPQVKINENLEAEDTVQQSIDKNMIRPKVQSNEFTIPIKLNSTITNDTSIFSAPPYGYTVLGLKMNESESLAVNFTLSSNSTNFAAPYLVNKTAANDSSTFACAAIEGRSLDGYFNVSTLINRTGGSGTCWLEVENFTKSIVSNQPLSDGLALFDSQEIIDVYEFYVDANLYHNITFQPDTYSTTLDMDLYVLKGNSTCDKPIFESTSTGQGTKEELSSLQFTEDGYYAIIAFRKNGSGYYNYQVQSYLKINNQPVVPISDGRSFQRSLDAPSGNDKAYFLIFVNHQDFCTFIVTSTELDSNLKVFTDPSLSSLFIESSNVGIGEIESVIFDGRDVLLHTIDYLYIEVSTTWATESGDFTIECHEAYDVMGEGTKNSATLSTGQHGILIEWRTTGIYDYDAYLWCDDIEVVNFNLFKNTTSTTQPFKTGTVLDERKASYIVGIDGTPSGQYLTVLVIAETVPCEITLSIGPTDILSPVVVSFTTDPEPLTYGVTGQVVLIMDDSPGFGVANVNMTYKYQGTETWIKRSMNRSIASPDKFYYQFKNNFSYGEVLHIYLDFVDYVGNNGSAYKYGNNYLLEIADLAPPSVQNVTITPEKPKSGRNITITAIIEEPSDASGFANATIWYSTDFGVSWEGILMQWDEETKLATGITPQFNEGTNVIFYINATDNHGNQIKEDNEGGYYGFIVGGSGLMSGTQLLLLLGGVLVLGSVTVIGGKFGLKWIRKRGGLGE